MALTGVWISAVVRCAPPGNKPTLEELDTCSAWLDEEMALLTDLRVAVCLGRIAFDGLVKWARRRGVLEKRGTLKFSHGAEFTMPNGLTLIASYHPSLQNTNTGKLTRGMFLQVFGRARERAGVK